MPFVPSITQQTGLTSQRFQAIPTDKYLDQSTPVYCGTSPIAGLSVRGFFGPGELILQGSFSAAAVATGAQSGTVGVGSTSTSIVKPTGAANWTASGLLGKFVRITGGGGTSTTVIPTVREITANTTTTLTIASVAGLDSTTRFEIVDPGTAITSDTAFLSGGCELIGNQAKITLFGFDFSTSGLNYAVYSRRNRDVEFVGCRFATSGIVNAIDSDDDWRFAVSRCVWSGGAQTSITNGQKSSVSGYMTASAGILFDNTTYVATDLVSVNCTANALTVKRANSLSLGLSASSGAGSGCVIETVARTEIVALTGTGNVGYGVEFSKGGTASVGGASITGTLGDFSIDGISHAGVTWAASSSYGSVSRWGTTILISGGSNVRQELDTLQLEGNLDITALGRVPSTGGTIQSGGRQINYGLFHLDQDDALTARAGGGQALATALGFGANVVTTCATAGDSVVLTSAALIGGVLVFVKNLGVASCNVFPATGGKINALAVNAAFAVAAGASATFISRNNGNGGLDWVTQ